MSALVKPVELPGRGRALVTSRPIKPGEVLLSDSPLLLYPASLPSSSSCSNCFRSLPPSTPSILCPSSCIASSCTASSFFCSSRCLSAHPPFVCLALSRIPLSSLPPDLVSAALFLLAAYNLAVSSPSTFNSLLSLHGSPGDTQDAIAVTTLHSLLASALPSAPQGFSPDLTAALLAKDRANAFGLMEPFDGTGERRVRAYGIYQCASLFNHDCLPNACRFDYLDHACEKNTDIVVRALHEIPEGREVCLSYFPVNWRYAERQKRLLEDYGFLCECDRCIVEKEWKDQDDEEDDGMEEEEGDEEAENMEESNEEDDFPHAYFFVRYLCDRENCGGTLAPLPPSSDGKDSNLMECNVCGHLRTEEDIDKNGGEGTSEAMRD